MECRGSRGLAIALQGAFQCFGMFLVRTNRVGHG